MHLTPLGFIELRDAINEVGTRYVKGWQGDEPSLWHHDPNRFSDTKFISTRRSFQDFVASAIMEKVRKSGVRVKGSYIIRTDAKTSEPQVKKFELIDSIWTLLVDKYPEFDLTISRLPGHRVVREVDTWPLSSADIDTLLSIPERYEPKNEFEEWCRSLRLLKAWNTFKQKAEDGKIHCIMIVDGDRQDIRPGYWAGKNCEYPVELDYVDASDAWIKGDESRVTYGKLDQRRVPVYVKAADLETEPLAVKGIVAQFINHAGTSDLAISLATFAVIGAATKLGMQGGAEKVLPVVKNLLASSEFNPKNKNLLHIIGETLPAAWRKSGDPNRIWDETKIRAALKLSNDTSLLS